jgi:hypothetical protein
MGVLLVDAGLFALLLGALGLAKPLRFLGIRSRLGGAAVMAGGLALFVIGTMLPAPLRRSTTATRIDDFAPAYQFDERHSIRVQAPRGRVFRAIKAVTADEILFFRTLTWIRSPHLPGRGPESILNVRSTTPILEAALRGGFVLLAEEPDRELVLGAVVCCRGRARVASAEEFRRLERPGVAKAVMNFLVEDDGPGWTRVTTQTRVFATDAAATRRFAAYWRVIYPGSALIRRTWLRAIQRRAESVRLQPNEGRPA